MKFSIILLILFNAFCSFAKVNSPTIDQCKKQVKSVLNKWSCDNFWRHQKPSYYFSPTKDFGKWVILNQDTSAYYLAKSGDRSEIRIQVDKKTCKSHLTTFYKKPSNKNITDKKLSQLVKKGKGIIYIWSPQMPLSVDGLPIIKKLAKDKKLNLIVLVDPKTNLNKIREYISSEFLKLPNSYELKMRNVYIHYPT
ncbi:MAG: hypothetical protein HON90_06900, partial [Halobacteriovoraceae bacterium]|nr:hypothetical protein [Halobacteriovoraceae bacterium]